MSKARELSVVPQQSIGFKNRIINGGMQIAQRTTSSVTPTTTATGYPVDRFGGDCSVNSKYTLQQSTTAPTGFNNSIVATSSSAYSVLAGDYFYLSQAIEGFNTADLAFGTINAKTVTLSFWVQSSLTGTFGGTLRNGAGNRSYPFSYSIPVANTWTQISVTIAGDTAGTWVGATNGAGLRVEFSLGVGSTYAGTAGSWAAGTYLGVSGQVNLVGTNGATFYITGVQLEKGSTATSFDYRPYGTELALCQRYFFNSGSSNYGFWFYSSATATSEYIVASFQYPVTMRAAPTLTTYFDGVAGKIGYMPNTASFAATAANVYGSMAVNIYTGQVNLYGVSARGIRGDYTASAEL